MSASIPLTADMGALFALSFAGIAFVLLSSAAAAKRIVLPVTLVLFHVTIFLVLQRSGAIAAYPLPIVLAALTANAAWVWWRIGYCAVCGRTISDGGTGARCSECAKADGR